MARVYVSIGSNIDRERNVRAALQDLAARYSALVISTVYESAAVGFDGDNFYNLVVGFDTEEMPRRVVQALRAIEDRHGRTRNGPHFSSRTLDLDLLLYDDRVMTDGKLVLPREEILHNAHVLKPLADIAGEQRHPVTGQTYADMWAAFNDPEQHLWPVEMALIDPADAS